MRVLVTGASGFVGHHVAKTLAEEGHTVLAGIRPHTDAAALGPLLASSALPLDLEAPASIARALSGADVDSVVHCAAYGVDYRQQDPIRAVDVNVRGTLMLGEAAADAGIERFVHLGTAFEYGHCSEPMREDRELRPIGLYGATKAAAAMVIAELAQRRALSVVVLRAFGLFGPGEGIHKLVPQIIDAVRKRAPLEMGSGKAVRDYLFVGDAARGIAAVATLPRESFPSGEVFNICSGMGVSIRDFATSVAAALGGDDLLHFGALPDRPGGLDRVVGDVTRWRRFCAQIERDDLCQITPLVDALRTMVPA